MKVGLIHHTVDYHKLCETVARVCYQSYHKDAEDSHNFIKAIMAKGHISIASTGNLVFGVAGIYQSLEDMSSVLFDLNTFREINPYVKVTLPDAKKNPDSNIGTIVSMNMLAFLDIYNKRDEYDFATKLFDMMLEVVNKIPEIRWFYDKGIILPNKENIYTAKGTPKLYEPIILEEDYTALKEKGLTEHELDIHSQVTVNFITDRSSGLQFWRHMAGGCELSQRYVSRTSAEFRDMVGLEASLVYKESTGTPPALTNTLRSLLSESQEDTMKRYDDILTVCKDIGLHAGRAKEIARSILPNAITTQLIQNRPLRYWLQLFKLRDSSHAQKEIQADVIKIKEQFTAAGIPVSRA